MIRSAQVEMQLVAMANAAERANRPVLALIVPSVLLIAALVFALAMILEFNGARARFRDNTAQAARIRDLIAAIDAKKSSTPDLAKLYPQEPFMSLNIKERVAMPIWGVSRIEDLPISISAGRDPNKKPRELPGRNDLGRQDVDCVITTDDLAKVFQFMSGVQTHEYLRRSFVSQFKIEAVGSNQWRVSMRFTMYEVI